MTPPLTSCCSPALPEHIIVDTTHPNNNREFRVFELVNIPGKGDYEGVLYEGWYIRLDVDFRWVMDFPVIHWWKAYIHGHNTIAVRVPAMDYDDIFSYEQIRYHWDRTTGIPGNQPQIDDCVCDAMCAADNKLNGYEQDDPNPANFKVHWRWYILEFPSKDELSVEEIFPKCGKHMQLEPEPITINSFHADRPGIVNTREQIGWKVIIKPERIYKTSRRDTATKESDVASKIGAKVQSTPQR